LTNPPILMFGATGQVACALRDLAPRHGLELTALSRTDADLTRPDEIEAAIAAVRPGTVVINAAAYTAVDLAETEVELATAINTTAPGVMAAACRKGSCDFIHLSTDYVFDGLSARPYLETDATNPQGVYGQSKLAGEEAVLRAHPQSVVIRTAWVYSPHGKNFVKTMLRLGAERDELGVVDDQLGGPTSAADIADGILAVYTRLATDRGVPGIFHLTGSGQASWADFADAIFENQAPRWGRRPVVKRINTVDFPTPAKRPANSRLDCDHLEAIYGFRAPPWRESLARVLTQLAAT